VGVGVGVGVCVLAWGHGVVIGRVG
jgi:hypothetical protein